MALAAGGDHARAVAVLTEALALAYPRGYVRVFADEGAAMASLLRGLAAARRAGQAATEYLAEVVRAAEPAVSRAEAPALARLVEP